MSIRREYKCNLCGDAMEPEKLYGVHFVSFIPGSDAKWIVKNARECETHICGQCVKNIRSAPDFVGIGELS